MYGEFIHSLASPLIHQCMYRDVRMSLASRILKTLELLIYMSVACSEQPV